MRMTLFQYNFIYKNRQWAKFGPCAMVRRPLFSSFMRMHYFCVLDFLFFPERIFFSVLQLYLFFKRLYLFLEREGEKEGEKHPSSAPVFHFLGPWASVFSFVNQR